MTTEAQDGSIWPFLLTGAASASLFYKINYGGLRVDYSNFARKKDIMMSTAHGLVAIGLGYITLDANQEEMGDEGGIVNYGSSVFIGMEIGLMFSYITHFFEE